MKRLVVIMSALILATFNVRADIFDLNWMSGCWALAGQDEGSIEHWSAPAGKTMLGFNRIVSGTETIAFEFLRIVEKNNNEVTLVASPSGQETASFQVSEMTGDSVVFENQDHDFPQRIMYRLDDNRNLVGRIEGSINGVARAVDFPMERSSCSTGTNE